MKIEIDKFELLNFIKGAAFGTHNAQGIWERCVNEFYDKLDDGERNFIYHFTMVNAIYVIMKLEDDPIAKSDIRKFIECYDPDNRYIVTVKPEFGHGKHRVFLSSYKALYEGKKEEEIVRQYHLGMTGYIPLEHIEYITPDFERAALYNQHYNGRFDREYVEEARNWIREL